MLTQKEIEDIWKEAEEEAKAEKREASPSADERLTESIDDGFELVSSPTKAELEAAEKEAQNPEYNVFDVPWEEDNENEN